VISSSSVLGGRCLPSSFSPPPLCSSQAWTLGSFRMSFSGTLDKCKACEKTVHFIDLLSADGVIYHKSCFRCSHCNGTLSVHLSPQKYNVYIYIPHTYSKPSGCSSLLPVGLILWFCDPQGQKLERGMNW
ncbi:hypothetical protein BHE74_00056357, partial [Ensete ventricosum]